MNLILSLLLVCLSTLVQSSVADVTQQQDRCPVCLGDYGEKFDGDESRIKTAVKLPSCTHSVCSQCRPKIHSKCPLCRSCFTDPVAPRGLPPMPTAARAYAIPDPARQFPIPNPARAVPAIRPTVAAEQQVERLSAPRRLINSIYRSFFPAPTASQVAERRRNESSVAAMAFVAGAVVAAYLLNNPASRPTRPVRDQAAQPREGRSLFRR